MPRRRRICPAGIPQHVIQRGNNRQPCFIDQADKTHYLYLMSSHALEQGVDIHAWVLMTNHIHMLVTPGTDDALSGFMKVLGQRYAQYFNFRHERTGSLWEGRYRSCLVDTDSYLLHCQRYIELNPVSAGMVRRPEDYPWSSYHCHAFVRRMKMHMPHPTYLQLNPDPVKCAEAYREFVASRMDDNLREQIRESIITGRALGSEPFLAEIEARWGQTP